MASSSIEWTEATWNPVTGCTRASAGCDLCYAVTMTRRLEAMGVEKYAGLINHGKRHFNGVTKTHPEALNQPFKRRKGTLWFVNSMSDLFHPGVDFDFVAAVYGVMGATPRHQYQVLTKRPERMVDFVAWLGDLPAERCAELASAMTGRAIKPAAWPMPNVWAGTTVEDERVSDRIDYLRRVPAAVRFLSCEPLIGPLDLRGRLGGLHWVIVGGESGHGARMMEPEWATAIQEACANAEVPYFFKQTGMALAKRWGMGNTKGSHAEDWPAEHRSLGVRQFPELVQSAISG